MQNASMNNVLGIMSFIQQHLLILVNGHIKKYTPVHSVESVHRIHVEMNFKQ